MEPVINLPLAIGDRVCIAAHEADSGIKALITSVCLRDGNNVVYECAYVYEGTRRTDWFTAEELKIESSKGMKIGFRNHT